MHDESHFHKLALAHEVVQGFINGTKTIVKFRLNPREKYIIYLVSAEEHARSLQDPRVVPISLEEARRLSPEALNATAMQMFFQTLDHARQQAAK